MPRSTMPCLCRASPLVTDLCNAIAKLCTTLLGRRYAKDCVSTPMQCPAPHVLPAPMPCTSMQCPRRDNDALPLLDLALLCHRSANHGHSEANRNFAMTLPSHRTAEHCHCYALRIHASAVLHKANAERRKATRRRAFAPVRNALPVHGVAALCHCQAQPCHGVALRR